MSQEKQKGLNQSTNHGAPLPDFRKVFECAPDPLLLLTHDFIIADANEAYCRSTHLNIEECRGRHVFDVFPDNPDDEDADGVSKLSASLKKVLQTKKTNSMAIQKYDIPPKGDAAGEFEIRYWSPINSPILNEKGEVTHILHRVEDVTATVLADQERQKVKSEISQQARENEEMSTKLKKVQSALKASEERFRAYAEAMPQMAFIADPDGNITYFNKRWYDFIQGGEGTEGWGWKKASVHHPDDLERTIQRWNHSLATGESYEIEYRLRRFDGVYIWHLGRAIPVKDNEGKITAWFGTNTDISHIKETERKLKKSEERLTLALEASQTGFWDWNATTGAMYLSDTLLREWGFGVHARGLKYEDIIERIHPDDRADVEAAVGKAVKGAAPYDIEYRVIPREGELIWINAKGKHFRDEEKNIDRLTGITINITERKQASVELENAKAEAERANALKSAFLANMSHEIRTPLGVILGFTDILKKSTKHSSEADSYLDVITRNGEALTKILDDILDLSKIEAGKLLIDKSNVNLSHIVKDVVSMFEARAKTKGITLQLNMEQSDQPIIKSDEIRLRQILVNLIGNAVKFTDQGSVEIVCDVEPNKIENKAQINIKVIDTGVGLSQEQADHIFAPFHQGDNKRTRKFGGTGLGLTLSKRLAQALGGDVKLDHFAPGEGCHFRFELLCEMTSEQEVLEEGSLTGEDQKKRPLEGLNILVVDDSSDNRRLVDLLLKHEGAKVSEASDGEQGVEKAIEHSYDVLLMDIQMPRMDGYTALKKLQEQDFQSPVIALTAHAMKEERDKTKAAGFSEHVSKPIDPQLLVEVILRLTSN